MSLSDDELNAATRRQRASLDAQRFMPKQQATRQTAIAMPAAATPSSSTFLLPILLPTASVMSSDIETTPVILKELSNKTDGRSSTSAPAVLPPEIANADLAIAVDRSFIETSSGFAARQLKMFYERMGGEVGPGRGPRLPYVITSLPISGEQKYRVSLRQDSDLPSDSATNGGGRPSSIIPAIGGIIKPFAKESARNSHPGGQRQVLRRPRSISEPRESNVYAAGPSTGIVGGFVNPFAASSRHSLDHRRPSADDIPQSHLSNPYSNYYNDNSPFGPGVIYTEPSAPSSPHAAILANPGLREMQSFESGFTARIDDSSAARHSTSQFHKEPFLNHASALATPYSTLVFDILQIYRGAPLPDRLSETSNEPTIKLSSTVTAVPSDDPRFVIWGELHPDRLDDLASSHDSHTDLSTTSNSGVSPRRKASHARSTDAPLSITPIAQSSERVIVAATIERWIAQLTSENESFELLYFFLTYRIYISGVDLCHLLICRFHWALEKPTSSHDKTVRAMVRVRTYKMIRHWLLVWFKVDFSTNLHLCQVLTNWVNTLRKDPALTKLPDALDLIRRIKKLIRDCKDEAERSKPASNPENPSSGDLEIDGTGVRNVNPSFNELAIQPLRGAIPNLPAISQTLTPVLGSAFAVSGSMDLPTPPTVLSTMQAASVTSHSSAQTFLTQPLHMAILSQPRVPALPTHPPLLPISVPGALPMQHSAISRAFVNTMGKLGRWKRVLNARSAPVPSQLDCSGVSSFDIEQVYAGDLQYNLHHGRLVAGTQRSGSGLVSDPAFANPLYDHMNDQEEETSKSSSQLSTLQEGGESDTEMRTPQPSLMLPKPPAMETLEVPSTLKEEPETTTPNEPILIADTDTRHQEPDADITVSLHTTREGRSSMESEKVDGSILTGSSAETAMKTDVDISDSYVNNEAIIAHPSHPAESTSGTSSSDQQVPPHSLSLEADSRRQSIASSELSQRNSFWNSSEEDYGEPISGNAAWFSTRKSEHTSFVEYDSSDEQSSMSHHQARKLPKRLPHGRDLQFVSRADSLTSYREASTSRSSLVTDEEGASADPQAPDPDARRVYQWQLEYIDSEEDEPRDVEAALRRLEGHVDRDRQRRKETKIDGWLKQVEERKARGPVRDEVTDDEGTDLQSSREDPDELRLETPPDESPIEETQIEKPTTPLMSRGTSASQATEAGVGNLDGTSVTPLPEQVNPTRPYQYLQSDLAASTVPPWSDAHPSNRSHKYSLSLSHKQSAFRIGEPRPIPPAIPAPNMYESWILVNRSLKIAQHLTIIESDLWRNIPFEDLVVPSAAIDPDTILDALEWGEFVKQKAKYRGGNAAKGHNDLLIARARFQLMVRFTASEILLTRPHLRPLVVSKFIRIALKCYTLNNFSSLVAIITGLGLPPVQAATQRMPKKIGSYETRILDGLKSFSSSDGNYRLIREAIAALVLAAKSRDPLVSQSTTAAADVSHACIPHIGIYLSQLYKYDRLPDYVDPTSPAEPVDEEPNGTLTQPRHPEVFANLAPLPSSMTLEPLINVHKQRLIAGVVINFMHAQQLTGKYKFVTERKLHQRCLKLRAFDMVTLQHMSQAEQ